MCGRPRRASGTGAFLHKIPVASGATEELALHGGEDYELLYPGSALPAIAIGVMNDGFVTLQRKPNPPQGWDHFSRP